MLRNREDLDSCIVALTKRGESFYGTPESVDRAIVHYFLEGLRETLKGCKALSVEDLAGIPLRVTGIVEPFILAREGKV